MSKKKKILIISIISIVCFILVTIGIIVLYNNFKPKKKIINRYADLSTVVYDNNKVNIYLFWGEGCPHCKKEFDYLESLLKEYGSYFEVYAIEVSKNIDNRPTLEKFSKQMGDNDIIDIENNRITFPYTIIGTKTFKGFSELSKDKILDAITSEHIDSYDVYLDDIKETND